MKTLAKDLPRKTKTKMGNSFAMGWIKRVYEKVKEFAKPSPNIVKEYIVTNLSVRKVQNRKTRIDGNAFNAGLEAGVNAVLNNPINGNELRMIGK